MSWGARILSAEAMREVDRRAIEEIGIPSLVLMENAARGVFETLEEMGAETIAVFCGPGNNGGDGLALARHLDAAGRELAVFVVSGGKELKGDAARQHEICARQGIELFPVLPDDDLAPVLAVAREADVIVDALFGTGLGRPLEGAFAELVAALNELPVTRLAVDLPSGLNGTRTDVFGPTIDADLTVTFAALKPALVLPPAAERGGDVLVTSLGIPPKLIEEVEEPGGASLYLLDGKSLGRELPARPLDAHKGDLGHAVIVAGSPGKAGAAVLATRAAVRAGAGLVTVAVPEPLVPIVDGASLESMTWALPTGATGTLGGELEPLWELLDGKSALAVGPGLGQEKATRDAIRSLVLKTPLPLVLDADGLNAFAGGLGELAERPAPTVLTPHPGEMARLLGISSAAVQEDRPAAAHRAARESGAVVVLKGHLTLVATPVGTVHVNPTGNPGMATGGTGDVLTGLLVALLGRAVEAAAEPELGAELAACLAVYLHGLAGDLAAEIYGEEGLAAGDLLETLPDAFEVLIEGESLSEPTS